MCIEQSNQPSGSGLLLWPPQDDDLRSSRFPLSLPVPSSAIVQGLELQQQEKLPPAPPPFLGLVSGPPFLASGKRRLVQCCAGRRRIELLFTFEKISATRSVDSGGGRLRGDWIRVVSHSMSLFVAAICSCVLAALRERYPVGSVRCRGPDYADGDCT
ncbi:hypothetical protein BDV59DRAFT_177422 [Aspergillus ambiguus]|uniref:uncharacterized protein n=1 Tax=Aspergillus ambiguus TaxID=176160 RepID=UPI003CCCF993